MFRVQFQQLNSYLGKEFETALSQNNNYICSIFFLTVLIAQFKSRPLNS